MMELKWFFLEAGLFSASLGAPPPIQLAPGLAVKPEAWKMRGKRWFIIQPVTTSLKTFNFSLGAKKFYRLLCLWVCPLGSDTVLEQSFCLVETLVFCSRCVFIHDLKKTAFKLTIRILTEHSSFQREYKDNDAASEKRGCASALRS